ncbi:MAG: hypothetical protein KBG02_04380 [Haliscomenobacter sp.]|nr:hypothetical protein [Haliscomenobacter sp.]MBK8655498.1 hypothetical protein [Haliscomenobacter sp.]MBP9076072.1 hypothetical protein [Haliscomenobacter sp.]MBP9873791.1 hypothetical protein [Haliscomenobacter sp.]
MPQVIAPSLQGLEALDDIQLRAIGKRIANMVILSAEKATAHFAEPTKFKMPTDKESLEHLFLERFKTFDEARRKAAEIRVMHSIYETKEYRKGMFDDLSNLDLLKPISIADMGFALPFPQTLLIPRNKMEGFSKLFKPLEMPITRDTGKPRYAKAKLRIQQVRCLDETNPEWWGSDEIAMGGTYLQKDGTVKKVAKFNVGGGFDDGDTKNYPAPNYKEFANIDFGTDNIWPKYLNATLVLAEVDMGGLADFLTKLVNKVTEYVKKYLGTAIGAAIGGAIGGWIGAAIGAIVGYVLDKVIGWLISWWSDDIFPPVSIQLRLNTPYEIPSSHRIDSEERYAYFKGHGGHYRVTYDWLLN